MQHAVEPPRVADHRRRVVAPRKYRDGLMCRCRLAEKIDPALFLSCVLISQQREDAAALKDALNIRAAALFGQDVLTGAPPEVVHKTIEILVVERPRDRIRGKAEQ